MTKRPADFKPQLGLLPAIPDRPMLEMAALAYVLPVPPPEVHNIELVPDPDMLGNDVWGDCVFAAIENNRRVAAAALGVKITRLTAANVIGKYKEFTGITTPPGPGAVIQLALEWVRKTSFGWGGNHLLAFGRAPLNQTGARQTVSEFQSGIFAITLHVSQEYPARVYDQKPNDPPVGGHAMGGGTYTTLAEFAKTWGYMVSMTPAYFAGSVGEISVLVWDFQWESLSYERQTALIADVQALTGKAWTGPAPVAPPTPPPTPEYIPMPGTTFTPVDNSDASRLLDTRSGKGLAGPFSSHVARTFQVTGAVVPAGATAVTGNLTVTSQTSGGYLSVGPTPRDKPANSTLNFPVKDDRANGVTVGITADGKVSATFVGQADADTAHVIFDVTGYFTP